MELNQDPPRCQPFTTALEAGESAVTWNLHRDERRWKAGRLSLATKRGKAASGITTQPVPDGGEPTSAAWLRWSKTSTQTGSAMRVSRSTWEGGREGAQREGKPVTSPAGPTANDITRRARSQAWQVIYGKAWRLGAAAPELFQTFGRKPPAGLVGGCQGWAGGYGSRKAGRDSQLVGWGASRSLPGGGGRDHWAPSS